MKFGEVPIDEVEGAILAHGLMAGKQRFKKGRLLSADDVAALSAAGHETVVVARLEDGDVPEDEAARLLAEAVCGDGLHAEAPFTGRCNLVAEGPGLLVVDPARLDAINAVDEAITVATAPAMGAIAEGQMVATVKIIPFAAPRAALESCLALAAEGGPAIRRAPFRARRAALVQTALPATKDKVLDKTSESMAARLARLGIALEEERRTAHRTDEIAEAVRALLDSGYDLVLVAGASAIVDRRDVVPAGIEAAGGAIDHFGMPVDPGNLLLLGHRGDVPVIGLPGCARSPKYNGLDMVLERLAADLPVTAREITAMGSGGLLKEMPDRPQPRLGEGERVSARKPKVAALVLAGGQSRRMGAVNKLLADIDGVPMVGRVVDAALASSADPVVVVTGHEEARVRAALDGRAVRFAHNPAYADGLSTSLAAGLAALPEDIDAALVCLGDMPRIAPAQLDRLIAAYDPVEGRAICLPTFRGKRGNPVLWDRRFFAEMAALGGDVGARHLIGEHADLVVEVEMADDSVLADIDSPDALAALTRPRAG